ncbi:MAG: 2-dehydropantoate 2-reductase [Eubacteriales bacterium]
MRSLIVGSGAIGGTTAAFLTEAGEDITLLCHREETAQNLRESGLRITGKCGEKQVRLSAVGSPEALSGSFDYIMIVTKAYDMPRAAESVLPWLAEDGLMVSVQNGMCIDELAAIAGKARSAACIVSFSATFVEDGHVDFTGEGGYLIGRVNNAVDEKLLTLAACLSKAAPAQTTNRIMDHIYSKLIINACITCGGAFTGQTLGQMLKTKTARQFFLAICREALAVADATGLQVPPLAGKVDYHRLIRGDGMISRIRRYLVFRVMGSTYKNLTSSSLTALRRGKQTEIEYLNGYIARMGRQHGVPTPVNDAVVAMGEEMESGLRQPAPENLALLLSQR